REPKDNVVAWLLQVQSIFHTQKINDDATKIHYMAMGFEGAAFCLPSILASQLLALLSSATQKATPDWVPATLEEAWRKWELTPMELDYTRNSSSNHKYKKNRQKENCFKCGLPGHYAKNCRFKNKSKLTNIKEKAEPIPYNVTNNSLKLIQVEENHKQLLRFYDKINGHPAWILLDSRASCNFINKNFIICYKLIPKTISFLTVKLADG
ncbi:33666_t:CDS:2, partial [Racocetra persica]